MLGIIGAMDEEVAKIKEKMESVKIDTIAGMDFFCGVIQDKNVVVVRSGIGKVNAAVCSQILIDRYSVKTLINTGIAGSLRNEINVGDIVLSSDALQHDIDVTSFGYQMGQIPRMNTLAFAADQRFVRVAKECCQKVNPGLGVHVGRILSGDQFISDFEKKKWLIQTFEGFCTEMEGAAIAQTAYLNQVPYLIIRSISDNADDSAQIDYAEFEKAAIRNSVRLLLAIIEVLE